MRRGVRPSLFAIALLVTSVALAGCTGNSKPIPAQSGTIEVAEQNLVFSPKEVTIKAGSTVNWTNKDTDINHDVTATDKSWESAGGAGAQKPGTSFAKKFDTPGTFAYYCTLHGTATGTGMTGKVIVVA